MSDKSRYQLRHAAGMYWLLDMEQPGYPYKKPLVFNEMGARIWNMLCEGMCLEQISAKLGEEYEIPDERIRQDIREFCGQLSQRGIEI